MVSGLWDGTISKYVKVGWREVGRRKKKKGLWLKQTHSSHFQHTQLHNPLR